MGFQTRDSSSQRPPMDRGSAATRGALAVRSATMAVPVVVGSFSWELEEPEVR